MRILRAADPAAAGGGAPAEETPPTAAETAAGGKTPREIALEKRISIVEDKNNTLTGQLASLMTAAEARDKAPAAVPFSAEGLLDEVNVFLGCGLS